MRGKCRSFDAYASGVISFLLCIHRCETTVARHANGNLDGLGMQIGVVPDYCRRIRVRQGGTGEAKQGKNPMSTATAFFFVQRGSAEGVGCARHIELAFAPLLNRLSTITVSTTFYLKTFQFR
jgi:hypothetical protein